MQVERGYERDDVKRPPNLDQVSVGAQPTAWGSQLLASVAKGGGNNDGLAQHPLAGSQPKKQREAIAMLTQVDVIVN
jgi:hypothetical protein